MNHCPYGYFGSRVLSCRCVGALRERYRSRLSGPFFDRLDLRVELDLVSNADLAEYRRARQLNATVVEQSLQQRIARARQQQMQRQACLNAALSGPALATRMQLTDAANAALLTARSQ